jgi:hypothetical protein
MLFPRSADRFAAANTFCARLGPTEDWVLVVVIADPS